MRKNESGPTRKGTINNILTANSSARGHTFILRRLFRTNSRLLWELRFVSVAAWLKKSAPKYRSLLRAINEFRVRPPLITVCRDFASTVGVRVRRSDGVRAAGKLEKLRRHKSFSRRTRGIYYRAHSLLQDHVMSSKNSIAREKLGCFLLYKWFPTVT